MVLALVNGQQLVFYNFSLEPKTVTVRKTPPQGQSYTGALAHIFLPTSFTIPAGTDWNDNLGKATLPGATSLTIGIERPGSYKETYDNNIRKYPDVLFHFTDNLGTELLVYYSYERDYKVQADASGNPGPRTFQLDEGIDYTN